MISTNLVGYCLLMPENCACERSKRMSEVFPFPKLNSFLPEFGINRSLPQQLNASQYVEADLNKKSCSGSKTTAG